MKSAIYEGLVKHRRFAPREHSFAYRVSMMYLDLSELDSVLAGRWLWSTRRPALARFRREDHLGEASVPLDRAVRELIEDRTGSLPTGPIRLLTQPSFFGYCFNPVSFYYCFDDADEHVETIVAEVNNTPWGERYCYVLAEAANRGGADRKRFHPIKEFHVSPFMPMDVSYDWRFSAPGERLSVHMRNLQDDELLFDATLALERIEITGPALASTLLRFPAMPLKVVSGIYWEALRLWLKRVPVYDHPANVAIEHEKKI